MLAGLVRQLHRSRLPYAVSSFPRLHLEDDVNPEPVTRIALPAGTCITNTEDPPRAADVRLELIEATRFDTALGPVGLYRLTNGGEIEVRGPEEPEQMGAALSRLADIAGGTALVDGGWSRRGFAAPGVTDGVILVLGAGYSATPERSAAAARYVVDTLSVTACDGSARRAWEEAFSRNAAALLDGDGRPIGLLPMVVEDPPLSLISTSGSVRSVALPHGLSDDFLAPLVRARVRCSLVVRDPTRIAVAPVYFTAWRKSGGRIEVVHPARIIAVATNPVNFSGPDADPQEFRALVAETLPELPVHDVVLESAEPSRRPVWKFWD